jgi:hypothetical protein
MTSIKTSTARVENEGLTYEIDYYLNVNTADNVERGAMAITCGTRVFRLKKDGSRGLQLNNFHKRLSEVFASIEPDAAYAEVRGIMAVWLDTRRPARPALNDRLRAIAAAF